jgi:hypothetical protein
MKPVALFVLLFAATGAALADEPAAPTLPPPSLVVAKPAPSKLKGRFLTYGSFGFNAFTLLGATAKAPETTLTPASRGIIFQQVGIGYFFHPLLRLQLTFIFGETVSNRPANTDTLSTFAIVPWLIFTTHGFFTGIGPQLAPISYGKVGNFDAGIYTATGYAVALGHGFSLPLSVQLVLMLAQRTSFAITPAAALAYRF